MMQELRASMQYLTDLASAVVEASRVRPGESVAGIGPNVTGGTLVRPGGRECYPAFWIRDFAMSLNADLFTPEEVVHALLLTAGRQANEEWHTPSGSLVPRGAIADHITFGGLPIFFPGTLEDYEGQGMPWGRTPSLDDHYYFVEMAWYVVVELGREDLLSADIDGLSLMDRLSLSFSVPKVREDTGMVWCADGDRGVSFGFTDTVAHTGDLFFCSVLRHRAAGRMADLCTRVGRPDEAASYKGIQDLISQHLPRVFMDESGLLRASTGKSSQPDVWGSAFAVASGALPESVADGVSRALCAALEDGTIAWQGQVRHVPTDRDFSEATMWEHVIGTQPKGRYQNGAYWDAPVGWVCQAVAQHDEAAAVRLALDYVADLRRDDFRQGEAYGAPWECAHPGCAHPGCGHQEEAHRQNPIYMASVTCPLGAFRRMGWARL